MQWFRAWPHLQIPAWQVQRVYTPVQVKLRPIVESNAEVLGLNLAAAVEAGCSRTAGEAASQELTASIAELQCSLGMSAKGGTQIFGSACLGQLSADARHIALACARQASRTGRPPAGVTCGMAAFLLQN